MISTNSFQTKHKIMGPFVQSIVKHNKVGRQGVVKSYRTHEINCCNFFFWLQKIARCFYCKSSSRFFLAKDARVFAYSTFENLMLTNEVISFKQLDPELYHSIHSEQFMRLVNSFMHLIGLFESSWTLPYKCK